jgi:hypothetical protein
MDSELTGGPKAAELPPETVESSELLSQIDFSKDLSLEQSERFKRVIQENSDAFGLDGRLGHYPAKVEVPLREGAKEISMPPFFTSPVNREVMDKQMDSWIKLRVIEPSQSPWGAPAFITY